MELKKFRVIVVLLATIIVSIIGFLYHYSLARLSLYLLMVVVVFYFFGSILQNSYNRNIKKEEKLKIDVDKEQENERQKNLELEKVEQVKKQE